MNLSEIRQRREKDYVMQIAWDGSHGFNKDAALQDIGDLLELVDEARGVMCRGCPSEYEGNCHTDIPCDFQDFLSKTKAGE